MALLSLLGAEKGSLAVELAGAGSAEPNGEIGVAESPKGEAGTEAGAENGSSTAGAFWLKTGADVAKIPKAEQINVRVEICNIDISP